MPVTINGSAGVTTNSGAIYNGIQRATSVTASGTSIDFTNIPSWVKRITVMFQGVSTNGSVSYLVQIGSGGITSSGYVSTSVTAVDGGATTLASSTSGYIIRSGAAANVWNGQMTISNITGNSWVAAHIFSNAGGASMGGGNVSLSGTLDRLRFTTTNGTDSYDAGTINILYE